MNICFFFGGFSANGGIGRVTSILTSELQNYGYQIFICAFCRQEYAAKYPINHNCICSELFSSSRSMTKAIVRDHAIHKMVEYIKKNQLDVIIACGAIYYPIAAIAAKICKIKLICWEHISPNIKLDYKFQDQARIIGAKLSDVNILLTKSAQSIYQKRFPQKRNEQIYNPIDPMLANKPISYNTESKKIISVGRLGPQKNFDRLLEIAKVVFENHPEWTWDIYGEGSYRGRLLDHAKRLQIDNKVHFVGQVQDLYDRYKNYSFIVMTSDYEGFPMTLLEGAANGLPMISFDIETGPNEIINDGVNGYLCEKNNEEEMLARISTLITDVRLRSEMSKNAFLTSRNFYIEDITKQWISIIMSLENK